MPVHDLGYRNWTGRRADQFLRPLVIARGGISLILKKRWLRMLLTLAWLPVIFPAFGIFAFEYSSTEPGLQRFIVDMVSHPLQNPELGALILTDTEAARHQVWSTLILAYLRYPQLFAMVGLIGLITPLLVSYDLRTKAYLLYFSRPLTPSQYILGKSAVIWFCLTAVVTVPALLLYVLGVLLSPDFSVIGQTWDILPRTLIASAAFMIPTTMLAVLYSSLTGESRYATFAWFATWVMGFVAYQFLTFTTAAMSGNRPPRRRGPVNWEEYGVDLDRWRLLSPYHTLGKVEAWVFGLDTTSGSVWPACLALLVVTVGGFWIVHRRIVARLSV